MIEIRKESLTKADIDVILSNIKEHDLVVELRLVNGNCGMFALALQELLDEGEIFTLNAYAHILLSLDNFLIDGEGKWTEKEILENWGGWGRPHLLKGDYHRKVSRNTGWTYDLEEMKDFLLKLAQNQVDEVFDEIY